MQVLFLQDQLFRNVKFELIDECGEVNTISEHVAMMAPFYYIPLLLLLIVLVVKLSLKIRATYKIRYLHFTYNYTLTVLHGNTYLLAIQTYVYI